ncbi:hypothetical protein OE09_0957 [Flavobacteriaceae bacterium MAR_2010_72]|nr:hypothetical protein OE09_0957 [Flavobacteriaceae bacterium MAR_2010_72]TVZ60240.1 hypothetical protein NA63_2791 [Flavobacteriaceae bacterium MAR_2010_105]
MKFFYILCITLVCLSSCKEKETNKTLKESDTMHKLDGAWELVSFYNYADNKVSDSFNIAEGYRQVKIYTPTKVMWSKNVPTDSTEWFGYGSYKIEGDSLIEILDYGSEMMRQIIEERKAFVFELHLKENSFRQIELDQDGNRVFSENYIRIE